MSGFISPELPRDQLELFPPLLSQYVGPDSRVRKLHELLQAEPFQRRFAEWARRCEPGGRPGYHPGHLAALYIYGAMEGVMSSRRLEKACHTRIDFKWLMEGLAPDHTTIANFFKAHAGDLDGLFRDVLAVASEMGLVKLRHVSVDGTKMGANASRTSVHRKSTIEKLLAACEEEVAARRKRFVENDAAEEEDLPMGEDLAPEGGAGALRRLDEQRARMEATLAAIERRRQESSRPGEASSRGCLTDPDARHMKGRSGQGSGPRYNMQLAVDSEAGIVVGTAVCDRPDDTGLLLPMIEQVEANTGSLPEEVSADKAYHVGPDLAALERSGVATYIPENSNGKATTEESRAVLEALRRGEDLTEEEWAQVPKGANEKISREAFVYDPESDSYRCPRGEVLTLKKVHKDKQRCGVANRMEYRVQPGACEGCPIVDRCCTNPKRGRFVTRDQYEAVRERGRARMNTAEGLKKYAQRMPLAETPSGFLKGNLGIRSFLHRGLALVHAEAVLTWIAYDLRIMLRHGGGAAIDSG